tara:strand:+ start:26212 stop:26559 length:348 start_codon:yes stop_codon:yes gene_type:complete
MVDPDIWRNLRRPVDDRDALHVLDALLVESIADVMEPDVILVDIRSAQLITSVVVGESADIRRIGGKNGTIILDGGGVGIRVPCDLKIHLNFLSWEHLIQKISPPLPEGNGGLGY